MPSDPALVTGRLNTKDYVASRESDIKKLEELISNSGANAKKRAFQSLPRTERRRAASHNPKRVPRRKGLRKKAELENLREKAKKRKASERPSKPIDSSLVLRQDYSTVNCRSSRIEFSNKNNLRYGKRQRDKTWLPTHIWHRKRAFMDNIAGIMVPRSATQKQYRRTYRIGSHIDETGAMAWDTSYVSTYIVHHPDLHSVLRKILPGCTLPIFYEGSKSWSGMLPGKGPLLLYWHARSTALLQCHPLLQDGLWETLSEIEGLTVEDCQFSIGSIDITGPLALKTLKKNLANCSFTSTEAAKRWDQESSLGITPWRSVHCMFVSDPRVKSDHSVEIHEQHDPLGLLSKSCRELSISALQPQSVIDQQRGTLKPSQRKSIIPIILCGLESGRYRLLMPREWVLPFWLSIFRERHVILGGTEELEHLAFENGHLIFPRDFPETTVGWEFQRSVKDEKESAYQRKPKSKRANIENESGCPFMNADLMALNVTEGSQFCHIRLTSKSRGVPREGARIYSLCGENGAQDTIYAPRLVGFVTTGNFGLSAAKGAGLGIVIGRCNFTDCIFRNVGGKEEHCASIEPIAENLYLT